MASTLTTEGRDDVDEGTDLLCTLGGTEAELAILPLLPTLFVTRGEMGLRGDVVEEGVEFREGCGVCCEGKDGCVIMMAPSGGGYKYSYRDVSFKHNIVCYMYMYMYTYSAFIHW